MVVVVPTSRMSASQLGFFYRALKSVITSTKSCPYIKVLRKKKKKSITAQHGCTFYNVKYH